MDVELIDMDTNGKEIYNWKPLHKNSDSSKEKNIIINISNKPNKKENNSNKKCILIILSSLILLFIIYLVMKLIIINKDLINNNVEKNKGIVELISFSNDKIKIKKELLKEINSFVSCLGESGVGKSTFGSNFYKKLYKVKNDYFESSDGVKSFTKGIWMISDEERRRIPEYISKDFLDVEGFQVDNSNTWKYAMIIAFLSTDLIILNNIKKYDKVKKIFKIIEKSLKRMEQMKIPRILKAIYIQTIKDPKNQIPIEELLKIFEYDEEIFKNIKIKYIYLPFIPNVENEKELMKYYNYRTNFEEILNILKNTYKYNAVASLMNHIDNFNDAINGITSFNNQTILKDIEIDFNSVYSKYENKLKISLYQKIPELKKFVKLGETFEDFIKLLNLTFEFQINDYDFTFYGGCNTYDKYYEELKKRKSFRIKPKDIFFDLYNTEILRLESEKDKDKQEIYNEYLKKKFEIDNYFSLLKFYQKIEYLDLELKVDNGHKEYKLERENDLKDYFNEKIREKVKEWEEQIQRAKWKAPVQDYGEMRCENGHEFKNDLIYCPICNETVYWVDSDEKYVICKGCQRVTKISGELRCECGALSKSKIKWIKGYKP